METPGPGNDRSLTTDEARAWELIERSLRLRARRRHRVAGFIVRCIHRRLVNGGLALVAVAAVVVGAAALPPQAAVAVAVAVAVLGLLCALAGMAAELRRGAADRPERPRRTGPGAPRGGRRRGPRPPR